MSPNICLKKSCFLKWLDYENKNHMSISCQVTLRFYCNIDKYSQVGMQNIIIVQIKRNYSKFRIFFFNIIFSSLNLKLALCILGSNIRICKKKQVFDCTLCVLFHFKIIITYSYLTNISKLYFLLHYFIRQRFFVKTKRKYIQFLFVWTLYSVMIYLAVIILIHLQTHTGIQSTSVNVGLSQS